MISKQCEGEPPRRRKRLGVVLQYYDLRDDIPLLLDSLAVDWEIVLFARGVDLAGIDTPYEKRELPNLPKSIRNRICNGLYAMFGNIPASRENYQFWNLRRISAGKSMARRALQKTRLRLRLILAGIFPFDRYLNQLSADKSILIKDIDVFLATSDVYDINFLVQMIGSGIPYLQYIYSWDHAAKFSRFTHRAAKYLTWHKGISDDLVEMHGIDRRKIAEIGSTQMSIVQSFFANEAALTTDTRARKSYIYYAGTMGYPDAIKQELRVVHYLAETLAAVSPDSMILFRPYPNSKMFELYRDLMDVSNIELENVRLQGNRVEFTRDTVRQKYSKISNAFLFVHMGSTIGLEAAYFRTPVVFLAMEDFDYGMSLDSPRHLRHTLSQRHLQKYMLFCNSRNIVRKKSDLASLIRESLVNPDGMLEYNQQLTSLLPLVSIKLVADRITFYCAESLKADAVESPLVVKIEKSNMERT